DRLALGGGLEIRRSDPPPGADLLASDPALPPPDAFGRGRKIFRSQRCMSCHSRANPNGPQLDGVGTAYLNRHGSDAAKELEAFLAKPFLRKGILGWGDTHRRRMTIEVSDEAERKDLVSYLLAR
ncbi:MAG: c-type cytochrome, partial [Planctomycetes bacterium]|nr:c-type cytochrome [Planctomycetota bacterium]